MKKALILSAGFVLFLMVTLAFAHPPWDIKITFDPQTKILQAQIMHNVSNTRNHYIKRVDIGLNGDEVTELRFSKQDNNQYQPVTYFIPDAKEGDVISVEGYCSISGKLKKQIIVKL